MNDSEYRLKLRNELARMEGELAERAADFIDGSGIYTEEADMEENQIRNLLNVSDETRSHEAMKSFIRHQIGRSGKDKEWNFLSSDERFGERLILEFDRLRSKHTWLIRMKLPGREDETLWALLRAYLGYLNWCFVARKKEQAEEKGKE